MGAAALNVTDRLAVDDAMSFSRAGEIQLTLKQKLALLVMRQSDLSKAVLAGVIEKTHDGPAGRDFFTCAQLGLAIHKGSFHVLTPYGRWRADQVAQEVARAFDLHIISYSMGGRGQAAYSTCTCGWRAFRTRAIRSWPAMLGRDAQHHLQNVIAKDGR